MRKIHKIVNFALCLSIFTTAALGCGYDLVCSAKEKESEIVEITETTSPAEIAVTIPVVETETEPATTVETEPEFEPEIVTTICTEPPIKIETVPVSKPVIAPTVPPATTEPVVQETEPEPEPTISETEPETEEESDSTFKSLGTFTLTAYCACSSCCGKSDGITATGTIATQGRTIAVDPRVIPYGTRVMINGNIYIAEDCGGAIGGNRIDVFFNNHQDALYFGVQTAEVFVEV